MQALTRVHARTGHRSHARLAGLTLLAGAVLAGCGGGGGGGTPVTDTTVAISAANYVAVGQESVGTAFYVNDTARFIVGAQFADSGLALSAALAQVKKLPGWIAHAPHLVSGVVTTETDSCTGGGSVTVTTTDVNGNDDLDAGDSATAVFSNCIEDGVTLSGTLTLAATSVSGDVNSDVFGATIAMTLNGFGAKVGSVTASGSGSMTFTITSRAANDLSLGIAVASLTSTANVGGTTVTRTSQNLNVNLVRTPVGFGWSDAVSVSGTFSSTAMGSGTVTLSTVAPFVTPSTAVYPASGQLIATGMSGSKMRLTALSSSQVSIELDADGNGSYESTTTKAWSELR